MHLNEDNSMASRGPELFNPEQFHPAMREIATYLLTFIQGDQTTIPKEFSNPIMQGIVYGTPKVTVPYRDQKDAFESLKDLCHGNKGLYAKSDPKMEGEVLRGVTRQFLNLNKNQLKMIINGQLPSDVKFISMTELQLGYYLTHAVLNGNIGELFRLITLDNCNVNALNLKGWTALMMAVNQNRYEAAEFLLKSGADTKNESSSGVTALQMALGNVALYTKQLQPGAKVFPLDDSIRMLNLLINHIKVEDLTMKINGKIFKITDVLENELKNLPEGDLKSYFEDNIKILKNISEDKKPIKLKTMDEYLGDLRTTQRPSRGR